MLKNILKRALARFKGWRRFGGDIPAKPGQSFDIRLAGGDEVHGLIAGRAKRALGIHGGAYHFCGCTHHGAILRDVGPFLIPIPITHYRLRKPAPLTAEIATRALRENEWRDWAANPNPDAVQGFEEPARAPEGVR
jgi:hypothetical protein